LKLTRHTIFSVEDLSFELNIVIQSISKKISFIENQIVARTKSNITPEQMEQYSETFKFFDKDNSNGLVRDEFKAALQAEGTAIEPAQFEDLFLKLSEGQNEISFEQVKIIDQVHRLRQEFGGRQG
jgi:Ca2+-binding EF-hand superfamily protein